MKIRLLLADENPLFLELLIARFAKTSDIEVVAETGNGKNIFDKLSLVLVDIVLVDVFSLGFNGIEMTKRLQSQYPDVKVVILTNNFSKTVIKDLLDAQIWGYLLKNITFDQLCESLRQISVGKKLLSPDVQGVLIDDYLQKGSKRSMVLTRRENEILRSLAEGKSVKEIAEMNFISIKTAGTHKQNIFDKMGFENLPQLVRYALKNGVIY